MADKDKRVVHLQRLLDDARKYRKSKYDKIWDETNKWFLGEQQLRSGGDTPGGGNMNDSFRSDWVTNFMFALIMTEVPILANRSPEVSLTPIDPKFEAHAGLLNELIPRVYNINDYVIRQTEMVTNGLLYGRGYFKPTWNGRMRAGLGDIKIEVPDSKSIFKDKMWCRDSNWVFDVKQIDKLTLYQMYPAKAKRAMIDRAFLKASGETREDGPGGGNTGEVGFHAGETETGTTSEAYVWDVASNRDRDKGTVDLVEAWFVDNTAYDAYMKIADKEYKPKKGDDKKSAYPHGRVVVFIDGYEYDVLDDRQNPFPQFPYVEFDNYYIPGKLYGEGELEQLKPIQEQYNIRSNQISDSLNYSTFPITFYDHTSGLDPDEIENRPGGYYPIENVKGIHRFDARGPAAGTFESLPYLEHVFETISGIREVTQGQSPGDVRSGYAIEQLQEAAQNRLKLKTRNLEYATINMVRYMVRMMGLFYKPGVHYGFGDDQPLSLEGISPDFFNFNIKAGLSLPNSRVMEEQRYQWMYQNMIVDEEFIVENFDIPNKEELIIRMKPLWDMKKQGAAGPMPGAPAPGTGVG